MSQFCADSLPLWGSVDVAAFTFSATARRYRLDNRLPVALLSNARQIGAVVVEAEKLLGARFNLLQGFRCAELNWRVGGSVGSLHMQALAVDGIFVGVPMLEACQALADSALSICEVEAKQTQLHIATGIDKPRALLRQFERGGPVVRVARFLDNGVRV